MKVKSLSWAVFYLGIVIGLNFIIVVVMSFFIGFYLAVTNTTSEVMSVEEMTVIMERIFQNGNFTMLLSLIVFVIAFAIFGFWYYFSMKKGLAEKGDSLKFMKQTSFQANGFSYAIQKETQDSTRVVKKVKYIVFAIVISFFFQPIADCILQFTSKIMPKMYQDYVKIMENIIGGDINPYLMTVVIVFVGPIVEEIIFRGMIFRVLRKGYGFACSAIIGALFFAIYHLNLVQGIYCFVFGWVLCFLYEKTKSLGVVILAHMTFNASSFGWGWAMELLSNQYPNDSWGYDVMIWVISFGIVLTMILNLKNERRTSNDTSSFEQ